MEALAGRKPAWRCSEWRRRHTERAGRSTWERTSTRKATRRTELIPIGASRTAKGRVSTRWKLAMLWERRLLLLAATGDVLRCAVLSRL
jgi:hypothetical protein